MESSGYVICVKEVGDLTIGRVYKFYNASYSNFSYEFSRTSVVYGICNDYGLYCRYDSSSFMSIEDYRDYKIGRILGGDDVSM
jgi:hypothetical protein